MSHLMLIHSSEVLAGAAQGCPAHMTYTESGVVGLIQGVTELFPASSLGHSVLIPALIGGCWAKNLNVAAAQSPYLAFIVGLHVATAIALIIYFWRDWVRIIGAFFASLPHVVAPPSGERRFQFASADERLAWMLVFATIPVGLAGFAFDKVFREVFGTAIVAGVFLAINGLLLFAGEKFRSRRSLEADREAAAERERGVEGAGERARHYALAGAHDDDSTNPGHSYYYREGRYYLSEPRHASGGRARRAAETSEAATADRRIARVGYLEGTLIGSAEILGLLAGISRDGATMVAGMFRGLSREDAARFAFLLATPVILAAGALKVPELMGPLGNGIHGQVLFGSVASGVGAYVAVRFLTRYFAKARTLTPFAVYCLLAGVGSVVYLGLIR